MNDNSSGGLRERRASAGPLRIEPLTAERWPDIEALFASRGCSQARGCWCMYYRVSGRLPSAPDGVGRDERNRRAFKALVDAGVVPGLIAYRDGAPVGWISLGPREQYAKLARSPVMKPVDDAPVWSIVCFVVPTAHRGQGVARALLDGAVAYAATQGARIVEAYPFDLPGRGDDQNLWFGTRAMYEAAGFREVARRKPTRVVMRREVG